MDSSTVLLIDDHPIFLEGLRRVLAAEPALTIVGEADTVAGAVAQARALRPDLVVLDLNLKDGSGLEALPRIVEDCPGTRVLVLSGYGSEHAMPVLRLGARGFVRKDMASTSIVKAIQAVLRGEIWAERYATASLVDELFQQAASQPPGEGLTPRERDVLHLVGEGKRNPEIARELSISENTVKTHISSLMRKLEIDDRLQLALYADRADRREW
jgi:DNA-binding NarL/FixJ family response regulator